jgi:hypothetical protein
LGESDGYLIDSLPLGSCFCESEYNHWPGTSIKRGGYGGSVKCHNSNLQQLFQVGYALEFGEQSTKQPQTKFQTKILMYDKTAAF